jgi:hypothetical protein
MAEVHLQRRLAAIMSADVVGYSRLGWRSGAEPMGHADNRCRFQESAGHAAMNSTLAANLAQLFNFQWLARSNAGPLFLLFVRFALPNVNKSVLF